MSQAEGQQKNLVHSIDSLPTKGPLSCLDQDLLLLKATSAATLSCLGECLNILQQTQSHSSQAPPQSHASQRNRGTPSGESATGPIPVLLLEPPMAPATPSPLSFQSSPPEPSYSGKAKLGQLDCGSCPCLMGMLNLIICSKCCWMSHPLCLNMFTLYHFCLSCFVCVCLVLLVFVSSVSSVPLKCQKFFKWYQVQAWKWSVYERVVHRTPLSMSTCMSGEKNGLLWTGILEIKIYALLNLLKGLNLCQNNPLWCLKCQPSTMSSPLCAWSNKDVLNHLKLEGGSIWQ